MARPRLDSKEFGKAWAQPWQAGLSSRPLPRLRLARARWLMATKGQADSRRAAILLPRWTVIP